MFTLVMHGEVRDELVVLPASVQGKIIRQLDKLRQNPTALRAPDTKPLGNGLFEIRTVGFFNIRGIYVYRHGRIIWLLRVFVKKTQKTPAAELALAIRRLKEMQDEQENH
ncbi:type II toxin-antitoxin system RelE/ParE family toxin [Scandinavium goeteborgense]|uniref:type II toxin-antitoxin system RelE/ParE family toxin n=1 Tax=Scandinavium goeteborgense TaxID=1851514 RepID=UPI002165240B|nr:type II toxin-antitoxin system RelE/ParE family toxin [Scandinavium goeteborgense]MCS2153337.1 type II toxin-antitoxin system RelE/ParE family toxin [Scandinavium goeteborgense]